LSLIVCSSLCDFIVVTRRRLWSGAAAAPGGEPVAARPLSKNFRLIGINGWAALVCCLLFLPRVQLLPAAMLGNLTLVQEYLDDCPKTIHLSSKS
jgi:hypothetical protein